MKILMTLVFTSLFVSCIGQTKENEKTKVKSMVEIDSLKRPNDAFQMNMGFDDSPAWIWVKFDNYLSNRDDEYRHIYGINFWDEEGFLYKGYYEQDRELKLSEITNFEDFIIKRYPGDKTFQLINKENDTLYLFNVLENKEYRRNFKGKSFQRIPTVKLNNLKQKVSGYDIEVNVETEKDNIYLVTIIDSEGVKSGKYKSNCQKNYEAFVFSYFDVTNSRIYLLEKDCFLEEIKD